MNKTLSNVWFNKYRPVEFDQVIGQQMAVKVLSNSIATNRIKNGYLLSGNRGVGKTTLARIFANTLNGVKDNPEAKIDILEMDAASNTSVDDIRNLIENASTPPLVANYKIFIIDEVHMLSKTAMNALLKILEEPPFYLVFVFATTNPEKIIPTVLSRLIKIDLTDHLEEELIYNLKLISTKENLIIDNESLLMIAKKAKGGQRDAINYLQTLAEYNYPNYTSDITASILGIMPKTIINSLIVAIKSQNTTLEYKKTLIKHLEKLQITPTTLINQLLESLLDDHFNNITKNSDLIPVLADYSNKTLPINNVLEVIAYLDYKYQPKLDLVLLTIDITKDITEKKVIKIELKQDMKEDLRGGVIEDILEDDLDTHLENIIEDFVVDVPEDHIIVDQLPVEKIEVNVEKEEKQGFDIIQLNKILQLSKKNKNIPLTLKQIVEKATIILKNNKLVILGAVLDKASIDFVEGLIKELLGIEVKLNNLENDKVGPIISIKNKTPSSDQTEHFYSIYNNRPINTPESINIVDGPIPKPVKKELQEKLESTKEDNQEGEGDIHNLLDLFTD